MKDVAKFVLAEAAKSNVEKRKVGCAIVDDRGIILAKGHNCLDTEGGPDVHAEAAACKELIARAEWDGVEKLTAYVSQPPCPACAELLAEHGVAKVEVVEAFMKFDSDKLRFDLVDGGFMLAHLDGWKGKADTKFSLNPAGLKRALWLQDLGKVMDSCHTNTLDIEERLARVLTFGARKYKPNNWRQNTDIGRYWAAAHRHLNAMIKGEAHDPESGFEHLDHLWCNIMFIWVLDKDARNSTTSSTS